MVAGYVSLPRTVPWKSVYHHDVSWLMLPWSPDELYVRSISTVESLLHFQLTLILTCVRYCVSFKNTIPLKQTNNLKIHKHTIWTLNCARESKQTSSASSSLSPVLLA